MIFENPPRIHTEYYDKTNEWKIVLRLIKFVFWLRNCTLGYFYLRTLCAGQIFTMPAKKHSARIAVVIIARLIDGECRCCRAIRIDKIV